MVSSPVVGALRVSHHYVSTVVGMPAEQASVALDRLVRELPAGSRRWATPVAREAPWGTRYWPRLTVIGHLDVAGRDRRVELEVWPWDDGHAEVGLRPVTDGRPLPDRETWVEVAAPVLAEVVSAMARTRSVGMHPAGSLRGIAGDQATEAVSS